MPILNKTFIDKVPLPPLGDNGKKTQDFHRDSKLHGFGLRVTSGGTKSFIVEKRINGKVKRKTLGKYGTLTAAQARKLALQFLGEVAQGKDPIAEKKSKELKGITLKEAFDDYLTTRKNLKDSTKDNYQQCLDTVLKDWQQKPLTEITKDMVEIRHKKYGKKSPTRANNAMRVLRAVFNHAQSKYEDSKGNPIILVNPVVRLSQSRAWFQTTPKQTLIRDHQLKDWYETVLTVNETTRDAFILMLLTGLRKTEALSLKWEDINFPEKSLTVSNTKNSRVHTLPLPDFLENLLRIRFESRVDNWVFSSPVREGPLTEPRDAVKKISEVSGVTFTLHDLRRTFITKAESLDIPAYALKRLLNHKDPNDVTEGYIIFDINRLREPMQKITDAFMQIIETEQ